LPASSRLGIGRVFEEQVRASMGRMDAAHRPVAAVLIIELMREATSRAQTDAVRQVLVESGIVQLAEKGTRRLSPWRRALAGGFSAMCLVRATPISALSTSRPAQTNSPTASAI
jgi:hypothetical protein